MRRLWLVIGLLGLAVPPPASAAAIARPVECQDYCAERAADHCERIDSWKCTW